jgi:hypothetical protein
MRSDGVIGHPRDTTATEHEADAHAPCVPAGAVSQRPRPGRHLVGHA